MALEIPSQAHLATRTVGGHGCTRCLPERSPKPKSCRSMFPETAAAPFESDAEGGGSFQSFEFEGRWESAMSFGTTGDGWATWVGECCNQLDAFEYTSIVCRWSPYSTFFSLFPFSVARRYCCTFSRRLANTQLRLNNWRNRTAKEEERMEKNGTFRDDTANRTAS